MKLSKAFTKALMWTMGLMLFTVLTLPAIMYQCFIDPPRGTYAFLHNVVMFWWLIGFLPTLAIYYRIEKREETCLPLP